MKPCEDYCKSQFAIPPTSKSMGKGSFRVVVFCRGALVCEVLPDTGMPAPRGAAGLTAGKRVNGGRVGRVGRGKSAKGLKRPEDWMVGEEEEEEKEGEEDLEVEERVEVVEEVGEEEVEEIVVEDELEEVLGREESVDEELLALVVVGRELFLSGEEEDEREVGRVDAFLVGSRVSSLPSSVPFTPRTISSLIMSISLVSSSFIAGSGMPAAGGVAQRFSSSSDLQR